MLFSRVIGFFREWALAYFVGANGQTDVYLASFTIPDFMNYLMAAGALSVSFIPVLSEAVHQNRRGHVEALFRTVTGWMGGFFAVILALTWMMTGVLVEWVAPGFSPAQKLLLEELIRIILPAQFFFFWGGLANALQQAHGVFLYTALGGIFYNTGIVLLGVLLHARYGVKAFSFGVLVGALVSHGLLQMLGLIKLNYRFWPRLSMTAEVRRDFAKYLYLSFPIMLGFSLVVTDEWISKYLASSLEARSVSYLSFARTLMRVPVAIVGQVAGIASYPFLARLWAERNFSEYGKLLSRELAKIWLLGSVAAIFLFTHALPITHFIYRGGRFTLEDLTHTADLLRWFSLGVPFWIAQVILSRGFYASQRTWLPTILGTILSLVAVPLYFFFRDAYQVQGLAMASSLGIAIYCAILWVALQGHLKQRGEKIDSWFVPFFFEWLAVCFPLFGLGVGLTHLPIYRATHLSAVLSLVLGASVLGGAAVGVTKGWFEKRLGFSLL